MRGLHLIDSFAISSPLSSCYSLFLTVAGTITVASIPPRVFFSLVLARTSTSIFFLAARQEFAILRHRRVLDHGEDCRGRTALGAIDVRRPTRLVHWVYRRLPADR